MLVVASVPVFELLLIGLVGAFLASGYCSILSAKARRDINKIVFVVFAPALIFGSLAKTITLEDIISWWFMVVNIAIIFLIGGILGWVAVKILKPERHLEGPIVANCSAGNLGFLLLMVIPAVCNEDGSPFGEASICTERGMSYNSLSMALGGIFIWTYAYSLMKRAGAIKEKKQTDEGTLKIANSEPDANLESHLLKPGNEETYTDLEALPISSSKTVDQEDQLLTITSNLSSVDHSGKRVYFWERIGGILHMLAEELMSPPTIAAVLGLIVGVLPWIKSLIIGASAPLRVIEDSMKLLGDGTLPCTILVLGGNLIQGLRKSAIRPSAILAIIAVKYVILPVTGIFVVKSASELGFLPQDPLYKYVLMLQFALPPATAIGTMAQLFDVGQEECSVIFLWTYLVAAFALTFWSTVFMYILS